MNRRQFVKTAAAGGLAVLGGASAYGMGLHPDDVELVRATIPCRDLPSAFHGFKIAFLSDTHFGSPGVTGALIERALDMASREQPDIICFGGDLITGWSARDSVDGFLSVARGIQAPMGVFGVVGNHELLWGEREVMRKFDASAIQILRNETVMLAKGDSRIPLVGLDHLYSQDMEAATEQVGQIESNPASLVLQHTPDIAPLFSDDFSGAVLCGHTHGGQICLPLIGPPMTGSRFGLQYIAGLYPVGAGAMYVTRGVGAVLLPLRVGCRPEVTVIKLDSLQAVSA